LGTKDENDTRFDARPWHVGSGAANASVIGFHIAHSDGAARPLSSIDADLIDEVSSPHGQA